MRKLLIINGPNLNLIGVREPSVYGTTSIKEYINSLKTMFDGVCLIDEYQSNHEGAIIDTLQIAGDSGYEAIILNAGGYSHTSVAIRDAISAIDIPVIEVHISNIFAREDFRHTSVISPVCHGIISGFGLMSYELAIRSLI